MILQTKASDSLNWPVFGPQNLLHSPIKWRTTQHLLLTYILLLLSFTAFSQNTFQLVYGGNNEDISRKIIQASNSDFLVLGMTKSFGSGDKDISISRIDTNGIIKWTKVLGSPVRDACFDMKANPSGGYIIASWIVNSPPSTDDWHIIKIDNEGNILSEKFFGGDLDDELMDIEFTQNGQYILAGSSWTFASSIVDLCIARMDQNMDFMWVKTFGTSAREFARAIIRSSDGNFVIIADQKSTNNQGRKSIVMKIDENGNLIWSKIYSGPGEYWGYDIIETSDGKYLLIGYTNSFGAGNFDIVVNKIDQEGGLIWAKTYGGTMDDKAFEIKKGNNGTYFISGSTKSYGAGGNDALLLNIDANGNLLGAHTYGGELDDGKSFLEKTNDGGYILASQTKSFGSGNYDNFIIKTDENGNSCCSAEITNMIVNNITPEVHSLNLSIGSGEAFPNHNTVNSAVDIPYEFVCLNNLEIIGDDTVCSFASNVIYTIDPSIVANITWILPEGASIAQNLSDTLVYINFGNSSGYIYIQSNACDNSMIDSLYVFVGETFSINLGNDTLVCANDGFLLNPGGGFSNYLWQDGSGDTTFLATSSGLYWVQVTDEFGCTASDSINIEFLPSPVINLGNDTLICQGDNLALNAGFGFSSYLWNTGSLEPNIVVDTSGIFWVAVTNEFGCSTIDSVQIEFYPEQDLDLGADTTFCYGQTFILNAGSGYTFYEWQDGSNDSVFIADTAGTYFVHVSNPCGESSDSINLEVFPESQIDLGNDTSLCSGDFVFLNAGDGFNSYLWQDGSQNPFLYAAQTGSYWVQAIDENLCPVSDTINLDFISPSPNLGNDTTVCDGTSVTFSASVDFISYLWQDGSDNPYFSANAGGLYWCMVTDSMGCVGSDSVLLDVEYPPNISLHNDTSICVGDSIGLSAFPTDSSFNFIWQDGSTDSVFIATGQGMYWLQASNECGLDTDSIFISLLPLPFVFIGNDTILTLNDQILLDAGGGFDNYLWNNGSTQQTLLVSDSGMYWVNVFDGQCYNTDTINIEPINCDLFVPNVFTPNGDNYNNSFYATVSEDITGFNLVVFNRWDEKVWETDNPEGKWDGKRNGHPAVEGTYFWIAKYTCTGSDKTLVKDGWVSLLR